MVTQSSLKMPKWHHFTLKAWSILPKGLINPSLNTRVSGGSKRIDDLPSGHPNLNDSHPGLLKDFPRGILIIAMLSASLRPKAVEDEATKDVKRLSDVGEAPYMVPLDLGGHLLFRKRLHPAWRMARKKWCCWAFPIFARCNRRPLKPVWQRDTRGDNVEGIRGPPSCKPCTWGGSPCITVMCQPRGPSLRWAIWECRPSEVGSYARFWP
jgi:hypothetical protein